MDEFNTFLSRSTFDFENYDSIEEGTIPDELLQYLKITIRDASIRSQFGTSDQSWLKIGQILEISRSARAANRDVPFLRYLNGIVLLGRNLVCTENGGVIAYDLKAGENSLLLLKDLLELESRNSEEEKLLGGLLQLVSNMASEMASSSTFSESVSPLQFLLDNCSLKSVNSFNALLSSPAYAKPTLQFIESSARLAHHKISYFAESDQGQLVFIEFLKKTEEWYSDEDTFFSHLLNSIVTQVLSTKSGELFLETFKEPLVNEDLRLSLLKVIDAALEYLLEKNNTSLKCEPLLKIFYSELSIASAQSIPFIKSADTGPEYSDALLLQLTNIWNKLVILLDIFQTILDHQPTLKPVVLQTEIIEKLVNLLGEAQKSLPRRSKLADIKNAASKTTTGDVLSGHELKPEDFPLIKGKIIYLLGTLVEGNRSVQDKIRQLQGLELVLSNCMIDLNNPYIRERSILCIRYLLDGNIENQTFVAKMEAKETVSEDALHQAGYETELVNGKVALKKEDVAGRQLREKCITGLDRAQPSNAIEK